MTSPRPIESLRRVGLWWRLLVVVLVFAMGLTGLIAGVGLSDREGVPEASLPAKVYYTLGLFVFGGLDLGVLPHFHLTEHIMDTVVLAGFGRFGQTVLDELQQQAAGLFQTVAIIDLMAGHLGLVFAEQVGFGDGYRHELVEADLRHPATWQRVQELIGEPSTQPVFVLGCGFDGVNIRTALWLSSKFPDAKIVARCFDQSLFIEQISKECGFEIVSTADLLLASMESGGLA